MSAGVMSNAQRLVYMVNQIAKNFAGQGEDAAVATADHLIQFWDPRMKAQIIAFACDPASGLSEMASEAIAILTTHSKSRMGTGFAIESASEPLGGSDAG